jgi:uncharacterized protein (UPF0276 family)
MIQLTVNYSQALHDLIEAGQAPVQGIEFGPWYTAQKIVALRMQFPELLFHFHHSNLLAQLKQVPGAAETLRTVLACTETPWVSAHLSMLPPGVAWLAAHAGLYLPGPPAERSYREMIEQVNVLKEQVDLPVLLENMPSFPTRRYLHEVDPLRIRRALEETGSGLLLDLPHARTAAHVLELEVHDYLAQLPLERARQIHVCGPRLRRRRFGTPALVDAHEPMQAEDYALLEWTLERVQPEVVTLEYFKDKEPLVEQLDRLAEILSQ